MSNVQEFQAMHACGDREVIVLVVVDDTMGWAVYSLKSGSQGKVV